MLEYIATMKRLISHGNSGASYVMKDHTKGPHRAGEWGDHKTTLGIIAADDPVTCAICAKENSLLDQTGWKCFNHIAKNEKSLPI
jgi:hypothetical protein